MKSKFKEEEIAKIYSGWFRKMFDTGRNQNEFLPVLIRAAKVWFGIEEEWRDVKEFEGFYCVSNFGRVKSLGRDAWNGKVWHAMKGRILRVTNFNDNYMIVGINVNGADNKSNVHSL